MNIPVNFELAKLLKEKGFNIYSEYRYTDFNGIERLEKDASEIFPYAPTIAEVVMWLYEKHGIWMWVERYSTLFRPYAEEIGSERFGKWEGHKHSTPTEAYLKAIEYTLNNLI